MTTTHEAKFSEALAHEIADALAAYPQAPPVKVYFDKAGGTHAVRITLNRVRYELLIPAPGACYALFRNGSWLGGVMHNTSAQPVDVAIAVLKRIGEVA